MFPEDQVASLPGRVGLESPETVMEQLNAPELLTCVLSAVHPKRRGPRLSTACIDHEEAL